MTQQEYQRRRQALLAQMQPGSAALIFAAPEATRSADSEYPYRQSSDFWYFTGFNEPEAVLVLIKSDDTHNHSVLFNRVRDLTAEIWFGRRLGQDAAPGKLALWRISARWKNAVRGCLSISWRVKFTTNLIAMARAIPPITPLSAAAKMAVSCITLKTKVKCATAI